MDAVPRDISLLYGNIRSQYINVAITTRPTRLAKAISLDRAPEYHKAGMRPQWVMVLVEKPRTELVVHQLVTSGSRPMQALQVVMLLILSG